MTAILSSVETLIYKNMFGTQLLTGERRVGVCFRFTLYFDVCTPPASGTASEPGCVVDKSEVCKIAIVLPKSLESETEFATLMCNPPDCHPKWP
jgi:hypothetical protein